jgi:hypothetical protein
MHLVKVSGIGLVAMALSGCSTLFEGHTQYLRVETSPAHATCTLVRAGLTIGTIASTPGAVVVEKTKDDITITCTKDQFLAARYVNHSGTEPATYGNLIFGGALGWAVDSATGSDNLYSSSVLVTLVRKPWQWGDPD